ncbi:protein MAIN-LIKE 1-like [Glycine max]|uniref:protein MAIN-LIKE 1-like n=1 Tax=Glycine max TaxID=3847 RepID=UPI0003DEC9CD|nr:protein MAIN-LIKE 1-like [Glycine max]|eukprot:XP_006598474.1 protein MAIN-LIKE 1-like [Glycine max]
MVRTRGLGRALGCAVGKVMGRRGESDDDVPQRRRPTASARDADVEGFPSGSHDTSVLSDFENHIALSVWNGEERLELKLSFHGRKMTKFGKPAAEIEGLVVASGLGPLIACSLDTSDHGLMSAFVEHWHKETRSFHLPVGEVTITLDDVASLLHFLVLGAFHSFEQLHVDDAVEILVELLEVSAADARAETIQCHGSYVQLSWLRELYELKIEALFLDALSNLTQSAGYAWGAAALVHMYDNLNDVSKSTARQLAGYITLLQTLPVATYRRCLDRLTLDAVCWISYGDHRSFREFKVISLFFGHLRWGPLTVVHRSERVVRQFSYIQAILPHPTVSSLSTTEIDDRWMLFGEHIAPVGQLCAVSGHCSPDYLEDIYNK